MSTQDQLEARVAELEKQLNELLNVGLIASHLADTRSLTQGIENAKPYWAAVEAKREAAEAALRTDGVIWIRAEASAKVRSVKWREVENDHREREQRLDSSTQIEIRKDAWLARLQSCSELRALVDRGAVEVRELSLDLAINCERAQRFAEGRWPK